MYCGTVYSKAIGKQLIYYSVTMATTHYHIGKQYVMGSHDPSVVGHFRLAILSNFPETISPEDYASLLPAVKLVYFNDILIWYVTRIFLVHQAY